MFRYIIIIMIIIMYLNIPIIVPTHHSEQDRMTFFVSQVQPGLGRFYLKTSLFASGTIELSSWALLCL